MATRRVVCTRQRMVVVRPSTKAQAPECAAAPRTITVEDKNVRGDRCYYV